MKKLISLMACAAILGLSFTSCDSDDDFIPNAIGDVYIKTIQDGEVVKHALVYYAYANEYIESAKVGTPVAEADSVVLEMFDDIKTVFRQYPDRSVPEDFSTDVPATGEYGFVVKTTTGHTLTRSDVQENVTLPVADISTSTFADDKINIKFARIEDAERYMIRFLDAEGNFVFASGFIENKEEPADKDFEVTNNTYGWELQKNIANVKKIQLLAFKFDSAESPNRYEVACISEAELVKPE